MKIEVMINVPIVAPTMSLELVGDNGNYGCVDVSTPLYNKRMAVRVSKFGYIWICIDNTCGVKYQYLNRLGGDTLSLSTLIGLALTDGLPVYRFDTTKELLDWMLETE